MEALTVDNLDSYFSLLPKWTDRCSLHVMANHLAQPVQAHVVVEPKLDWLHKALDRKFKRRVDSMTLDEISSFMRGLSKPRLKLVPQRGPNPDLSTTLYLDDEAAIHEHREMTLPLILQTLFQKFTTWESRLAPAFVKAKKETRRSYITIFKDSGVFRFLNHLGNELQRHDLQFLECDFQISPTKTVWNETTKNLTLVAENGRELEFFVSGRTPTQKRFRREDILIKNAKPEDLVPIEIFFLPYYRPLGHTSLRIGDSLYELQMKGWKMHSDGADSARAFLFNNPFFKAQYAALRKFGMPPVSFGKTILVEKQKVDRLNVILENLVAANKIKKNRFNILRNNCNQGIMRVLAEAGIPGFEPNGYLAFSSVLSFRRFLLENPLSTESLHVYPLPNVVLTEDILRQWTPQTIYRNNSVRREFLRTFPRYFHNIAYMNYLALKRFFKRVFTMPQQPQGEL